MELDEAAVVEEFEEFNVPQEEPETIEHLDAEMSALECTFEWCTSGVGGTKFKTPAGDLAQTVVYLQYHRDTIEAVVLISTLEILCKKVQIP